LAQNLPPSAIKAQPLGACYGDIPEYADGPFLGHGRFEKFKTVFSDVRNHLKTLPGFMHLTWWVHPDDPAWYNEVSFWASKEALTDWHMNIYHKNAKEWAARSGAITEDIITNFELTSTGLPRICPCCGKGQDKPFNLKQAQKVLHEPWPACDFHFPVMAEKPTSFAVFKDIE